MSSKPAGARSELLKRILEDVERYQERRKLVRSSIITRMTVRKVSPKKLHCNPEDEFTFLSVGPSDRIVEEYCKEVRRCQSFGEPVFSEPIIIERMLPEGYMILNGHHRWAAAIRMNVPSVRVTIVNPRV